eukprot:TRINITY_DN1301_c1_g2_i1.p1 TRINITY_DN1301_c1_g2~~TRINITY_DN1301_c1_g2_i1.p1  ORF type:complete len:581 (-),score=171.41 TRINITY_DN1301_c1_g2_i1:43-1749(-)
MASNQVLVKIGALPKEKVVFRDGSRVAFVSVEGTQVVLRKDDDSDVGFRAVLNKCHHKGGTFLRDVEDLGEGLGCVLTCSNHGWKLDLDSMEYVNPDNGIVQESLVVEDTDEADPGSTFVFHRFTPADPWGELRPRAPLERGEMTLQFYAHACVEVKCGEASLFTDPWLVGPTFETGWWLAHVPPQDWLERLAATSVIYISHQHSDHLNIHTLKRLAEVNPDVPIAIADFVSRECDELLALSGMRNVVRIPFGTWHPFGRDARLMILRDSYLSDLDTSILIDYKGHLVVNTVDCCRPNAERLPVDIDLLLTDFAGASSSFPHCWAEMWDEETIRARGKTNVQKLKHKTVTLAKITKPRLYVPFAGYIKIDDGIASALAVQNDPESVAAAVERALPGTKTWVPQPGGIVDIPTGEVLIPGPDRGGGIAPFPPQDAEQYMGPYVDALADPRAATDAFIDEYIAWAFGSGEHELRDNLIVHIVELDEDSRAVKSPRTVVREWMIDLATGERVSNRPPREHKYLRLKTKASLMRYVMLHKRNWETFELGSTASFFREPDVYNLKFWLHVKHL